MDVNVARNKKLNGTRCLSNGWTATWSPESLRCQGQEEVTGSVPQRFQFCHLMYCYTYIQGGAEPTDTFQTVIDNIWKQGKISETVYKYVQVCYLFPTDYKLIF